MLHGFSREPGLVIDLPRWILDAKVRKAPLEYRQPWWNFKAVSFVAEHLPPRAKVFEFGGGASTLWLLDRGAHVITIEDSADWYRGLVERLPSDSDVRFVASHGADTSPGEPFDDYAHAVDVEPDESLDLVIVDGQARRDCVIASAPKVRPGGILLLDDSQATDTSPPPRADLTQLRADYADLPDRLAGWRSHHFRGIKPGTWLPVQTTVWIKPAR